MGKRRTTEGDDVGRKKHKKNKHKKKARSREGESKTRVVEAEPGVRPLTLKIKLGKKPIESEEEEQEVSSVGEDIAEEGGPSSWPVDPSFPAVETGEEGSEGEDEEAWLIAMEKGQLDETGYVSRRPGSSLTARQRAILGSTEETLLELPLGKTSKEMTEEMILKKTEKNRKRRQAAQRRKEKRKADTVRKLLEKQSKKKDEVKPMMEKRVEATSYLHYVSSQTCSSMSFAPGADLLLSSQTYRRPPAQQYCAVTGCKGRRKYCDSTSGLPICSLNCYKTLHSSNTSISH